MPLIRLTRERPDSVYRALVASLFVTRLPTAIMGVLFAVVAVLVQSRVDDPWLDVLVPAGIVANLVRIAAVILDRQRMAADPPIATVRRIERRIMACYLVFASIMGAFTARVFLIGPVEMQMVTVTLAVGYAAGVTSCAGSRPVISMASLLLCAVPPVAVCLAQPDLVQKATGIAIFGFLTGGLRSILERYRLHMSEITMRMRYADLARQDKLTGLANRLALSERFERAVQDGSARDLVAVHCLDLDRFKPINDRYGHPVGDAVLRGIGHKLRTILRGRDIAARLGGDEFVLVQMAVRDHLAAAETAELLERTLSGIESIAGHRIEVGVSVGFAVAPRDGAALDQLLKKADDALLARKRQRRAAAGPGARPVDQPATPLDATA